MQFFLKLKHWELFLMLVLPTAMTLMFGIPLQPLVVATIGLFLLLVLFAWIFSIGSWANSRLPPAHRRNPLPYSVGLVIPLVYLLMYIILYIPELQQGGAPRRPPPWLLPMHMLSLAGIFYGLWYTARQLKSLQENEEAEFLIFSSTFFLLFIFPLGVWLIQPGVNDLYRKLEQAAPTSDET